MVPTACPLTPMARLPATLASLPLPPSAPASATRRTAVPCDALGMLNLTVQVVARPLPHCAHGSALVEGIATQPKRWLYGSFAAGFSHAVAVECGTSWKNQSLAGLLLPMV